MQMPQSDALCKLQPTCNTGHILDLLLCNVFSFSKLISLEICPPLAHTCDHSGLIFDVNLVTFTASEKAALLPDFENACYELCMLSFLPLIGAL